MGKSKIINVSEVNIVDIGDQGQGIGKDQEGKVYMVQDAVPGDQMDIEVKMRRSRVSYARPVQRTVDSPWRQTPFCSHFGVCGGCKWQHMSYSGQLKYKQKNVFDALTRIGGISDPNIRPIVGVAEDTYYRNKLDFSFGSSRWLTTEELEAEDLMNKNALGFHRPGSFEKIVDIKHCYLQGGLSNEIRNFVKALAIEHRFTFYNVKQHTGLLRNLIIRTALNGTAMITLVFGEDEPESRELINASMITAFPGITIYNVVNLKHNDTIFDQEMILIHGLGYLTEQLGHLSCRVGPKSFFQTNTLQALKLYQFVEEFANLKGAEIVYDLYSGTGTIGLFLARKAKKVIGVEEVKEAVADAHINAEINQIQNTEFFAGDVKRMLSEGLFDQKGRPDLIIVDPPRAGLHPETIPILLDSQSPEIVYVSCNPATQARDIKLLSSKYRHKMSQPVDMFPHTAHIENVTLLQHI
ncbi:MAG: 23S rRNA (uracil(1939)-C(5))-methyltransferase RlmD [Saprospiraceae bacterium]|nr:23S rRNA (uracil(1939)-C(5))-methyltransferase RlmD [Saprospiraceae bacterium]MBK7369973.1 23S rRNA (uracil(1939)-C(5))-methyltransferase RlmD [Saprospiraceae bacterium]MBK8512272.1 23S rRNA (uracil(1939)-C(5))-methyltransferase RlmD [Saprospiraceae bacterium]MBK9678828.1 23S rRNA (uracil(1939)-C(5))-methyltransferase RlmD [Saprospiraceae bacterium]MBK9930871.1 23S rRNA (uracil(1939)-C(5))-methyltransferase RlmD [Saprospiraceae bacterium]